MNWTLLTGPDKEDILSGKKFPWANSSEISFILIERGIKYWLIPPLHNSESILSCLLNKEELNNIESWRLIQKFSNPSLMDLAAYSIENTDIQLNIFFELLGIKRTHKSIAEWKEMGKLGENARKLYNCYEFPVNILRLWERLEKEQLDIWLSIFQKHTIKRNIVREIILYLYDLSPEDRILSLRYAEKYSENWQNTKSPFPSEEIRDFIKSKRFPHSESVQRELSKLRNKLTLSSQIHLQLPADLESEIITINIHIKNYKELFTALKELSDSKREEIFNRMFRVLNSQIK